MYQTYFAPIMNAETYYWILTSIIIAMSGAALATMTVMGKKKGVLYETNA